MVPGRKKLPRNMHDISGHCVFYNINQKPACGIPMCQSEERKGRQPYQRSWRKKAQRISPIMIMNAFITKEEVAFQMVELVRVENL